MPRNPETDTPLVLGYKSAIVMAIIAVKEAYGEGHPLTQRLGAKIDVLDWHCEGISLEGDERDLTLRALYDCVVSTPRKLEVREWIIMPPELSRESHQDENWKKAQAAAILGDHFASLMEPTFTAERIAVGLIEHSPEVDGPISASIPVVMAA